MVILFCSCSGTKKLEKSNFKSTVDSVTTVAKSSDEKQTGTMSDQSVKTSDNKIESSENKQKVTETKTTKFDGSKPIIPGTGKPPIIEETVKTETESNQKNIKIQEGLTEKLNKLDSLMKVNSSLISKTESKEIPVMSWWKLIIIGIVIGLIGMFFIQKIPFVVIWGKIKAFFTK